MIDQTTYENDLNLLIHQQSMSENQEIPIGTELEVALKHVESALELISKVSTSREKAKLVTKRTNFPRTAHNDDHAYMGEVTSILADASYDLQAVRHKLFSIGIGQE